MDLNLNACYAFKERILSEGRKTKKDVNVFTSNERLSKFNPVFTTPIQVIFGNWSLENLQLSEIPDFLDKCFKMLSDDGLLILKQTIGEDIETLREGGQIIRKESVYMRVFSDYGIKHLARHVLEIDNGAEDEVYSESVYVFQKH